MNKERKNKIEEAIQNGRIRQQKQRNIYFFNKELKETQKSLQKQMIKLLQYKEIFKEDRQVLLKIDMTLRVLNSTIQHLKKNKISL